MIIEFCSKCVVAAACQSAEHSVIIRGIPNPRNVFRRRFLNPRGGDCMNFYFADHYASETRNDSDNARVSKQAHHSAESAEMRPIRPAIISRNDNRSVYATVHANLHAPHGDEY